jgi:hypothetical protein
MIRSRRVEKIGSTTVRPPAIVFVAALLASALAPAAARAAQLSVDAPPSCVDPTALAEEVGELIGRPLVEVADVDFRIRIAETGPGKWRLHLETIDAKAPAGGTPATRGSRDIEGANCAELAEAASVAIAVSVRSMEAANTAPAPGAAASPVSPSPPAAIPAAMVTPSPATPSWRPSMTLALATDTGALPGTSPGVDLEGDLQRGALRLALLATWFAAQEANGPGGSGGTFQLALGGALACFAPRFGRWTPLACGGAELGRLAGTGLVTRPETAAVFWRAARAEAGATAALGPNTAILLRAGVAVPLARPTFVVDGSALVYRPSPVAVRVTAGFELGF